MIVGYNCRAESSGLLAYTEFSALIITGFALFVNEFEI
jgi:hypothetical protein